MVAEVLGTQKEYKNKTKKDIRISLFARFCYMFILDTVGFKKANSAMRFTRWLGVIFEK